MNHRLSHRRSEDFNKLFDRLPANIQELARKNFKLLKANPGHPSLEFKRLQGQLRHIWSARVGYSWRAMARDRGDGKTLDWFWIGTHERYSYLTGTGPGKKSIMEELL